ncbi:cytochrome o ubiquinol oxidase subunit I [Acidihalobacter ferrooxydans]|uniref:Cytochrome bo(3) ubiquinol oxidase subunit 1 n=1 Tax=Acidihalobacter ferrooxydans TaxID=1765967 RepID=A0A1P8UHL4_9GAMM|nr:cytochrome o ubiquinol oxidase subunit I [Acidihalobacter ferrooxydans]
MFGKLTWSAIPFDVPIVMGAVGFSLLGALIVLSLITYYGKWGYLWKEWITSVDHKKIGVMYVILALIMLLRGFADAIMMRTQQAVAFGPNHGYLPPEHYQQIFSAHGTIMILFMAMPFIVGLMNIVVPLQIGARDVAFPFMNSVSLWLTVISAGLIMVSLGIGDFSKAGWTGYPPLSGLNFSPDSGVDYWIWAIQLSGLGTLLTGINFTTTILRMRAPGMKLMRMPVFTWAILCTSILIILAFPVLTVTLALLSLDRYAGMHFFTSAMGGNMMLYANLFWVWGHPEVYIIILPAFGVFSEVVATMCGKRLFGYTTMVYATAAITVLSFTVWLHHFFTMGSTASVNAVFGIATMLIAIPTGVKIFNWLFTMYRGRVRFETPMLWTMSFLTTFTIGGMTGVMLAIPGADYVLHNSEFLVAHFHNVLIPGTLFGMFAGYSYWFPKAFGFALNEKWGKRAFWAWTVGFYVAFMPLYVLGFLGMPRRLDHYTNPAWHPWLVIAGIGAVLILFGIIFQAIQLFVSIRERDKTRDLTGDYWQNGRTLEWATASPAPFYNFAHTPVVHDLDAFMAMKEKGTAYERPTEYEDIHMPRNTAAGFIIGVFAFTLGFGFIWYIWWLVIASALGILGTLIARAMNDDVDYYVPAAEVRSIEEARAQQLAEAQRRQSGSSGDDRHSPIILVHQVQS